MAAEMAIVRSSGPLVGQRGNGGKGRKGRYLERGEEGRVGGNVEHAEEREAPCPTDGGLLDLAEGVLGLRDGRALDGVCEVRGLASDGHEEFE